MLDNQFSFSLKTLIQKSIALFDAQYPSENKNAEKQVYSFFRDRMAHLLAEEGFQKDVVNAVTSVSVDHVPDTWERVRALAALKKAEDFEPVAIAFKRAVNIIKKAKDFHGREVIPDLFEDPCESALHDACTLVEKKVNGHLESGDFQKALHHIAGLRDTVDAFFDGVMVMTDDEDVRHNRLALLSGIAALFEDIADFSKLST